MYRTHPVFRMMNHELEVNDIMCKHGCLHLAGRFVPVLEIVTSTKDIA